MEKSLKKIWDLVFRWLGQPNSDSEKILFESGLQSTDSDGLRKRFAELMGPILEGANLDLPVSSDAITGEWLSGTELNWDDWDNAFRRVNKNGPDAETFSQIETFLGHNYPVGS